MSKQEGFLASVCDELEDEEFLILTEGHGWAVNKESGIDRLSGLNSDLRREIEFVGMDFCAFSSASI
jgi:hypothetical protein